jgi:predicted DNA-binding protein
MTTMVRKQVYIEEHQEARLKNLAEETGQSEAEMIRAALDAWLDAQARQRRAREAWEAEKAFIESLLAQGPVEGGRTWTRDALYEERVHRYDQDAD